MDREPSSVVPLAQLILKPYASVSFSLSVCVVGPNIALVYRARNFWNVNNYGDNNNNNILYSSQREFKGMLIIDYFDLVVFPTDCVVSRTASLASSGYWWFGEFLNVWFRTVFIRPKVTLCAWLDVDIKELTNQLSNQLTISVEWVNKCWWGWQNITDLGKRSRQCGETQGNNSARWARSAGNSSIENLCILFLN